MVELAAVDTSVATRHRTAVGRTMVASSFISLTMLLLVLKHNVANLVKSTPLAFVVDTPYLGACLVEVIANWATF